MERTFLTGQIAKKAGVNVETLRFYEKKRLIPEPMRMESGYRKYPEETIHRIQFIKNAQKLGFTLKEIKELLSITLVTKKQCQQVKGEIDHKLMEVDEKIKQLQEISDALKSLRRKCDEGGVDGKCPILKFLYGGNKNDKD
ncbi:MAG: Mercuric resistance operon regulatory protein [Chlamydiae bacterium]|nr:Mercuric resistance operon regulatory protein [Chlamydiota bacterium]